MRCGRAPAAVDAAEDEEPAAGDGRRGRCPRVGEVGDSLPGAVHEREGRAERRPVPP